jgi:hypothetical protein
MQILVLFRSNTVLLKKLYFIKINNRLFDVLVTIEYKNTQISVIASGAPDPRGPAPSPRLDLSIASPIIFRMLSSPSSYL